jgi:fatty-acyl-CoA synthase
MLETVREVAPRCAELREIICFDDWAAFIATGDDKRIALPAVKPADPVMIQYTSGTTGFPKGALLHHRGLANNGADTADRMGIDPGDVFITTMPLFHTGGCVCCVLGAVSKAATQVLLEAFEPGLVLELFARYRGNAMVGVPTMLVAMLEHPSFASTDLSSVKAICSGGSTVPAALVTLFEQKLGAPFTIVFGQTECSPVAAQTMTNDTIADKAGTIGLPLPNMETKIINPDTGKTRDRRDRRVLHPRLSHHDRLFRNAGSDRRRDRFRRLAAYRRSLRDGRARLLHGRGSPEGHDHPRRGEHLSARTRGTVVSSSQGGRGRSDRPAARKWGEEVAAFIRAAPGAVIDKEELSTYMRASLAPHKTPRHWFLVKTFPLTGSGKIQKFKLRELWAKGEVQAL